MRRLIRCCPLMLVCLLFIASLAAVGYTMADDAWSIFDVSVLSPAHLTATSALLVISGGICASVGLLIRAVCGRGGGRAVPVPLGAAVLAGCVVGSLYFGSYRGGVIAEYSGTDKPVTATVGRVRYSSASYMIFDAQLNSVGGESCSLPVTFRVRGAPGLRVGECFSAHADIGAAEPYDDTALSLMYSSSEGRFLTLSADSLSVFDRAPSGSLTAYFSRLRESVGQTLSLRLGDGAGLCRALLLGDRSELGDGISDDFSALGISHIVAVSGLLLGIITAVVSFLLRRLRVPNGASIIITAAFALLFAALTGFSSSVLRSALMLMTASGARLSGRAGHMPTSLASAVALILLFRPCAVLDVGLVLSFSSTFGFAVIGAPLCRRTAARISRYTHDIRERYFRAPRRRCAEQQRDSASEWRSLRSIRSLSALPQICLPRRLPCCSSAFLRCIRSPRPCFSLRSRGCCSRSHRLHCCRRALCSLRISRQLLRLSRALFPASPPPVRCLHMRWDRSARSPSRLCCFTVCRLSCADFRRLLTAATAADAGCSR